ncbi:MAG: SsgA family sporulation/cell division regulator [Actinobacteria bacterium]|nr:SsgA family sporulation/cell division regulator [Actinomycetota bacterium]
MKKDERLVRFIEAEAGTSSKACWIRLEYAARDPLVVSVSLCAQSRATVIEREVMRTDLRDALQRRIYDVDLVMTPDVLRGHTLLRFREPHVAVTVVASARKIADFIRESDQLIPFGTGEVDALNTAFEDLLVSERVPNPRS